MTTSTTSEGPIVRRIVASKPEQLRAFGNNEIDNDGGTVLYPDSFEIPVYKETERGAAFDGIGIDLESTEIPRVNDHVLCYHVDSGRDQYRATAWTYLSWWENAGKFFGVYKQTSDSEELVGTPYAGMLQLSADWPTDVWHNGSIHYDREGVAYVIRELCNNVPLPLRHDPRIPSSMLPDEFVDQSVVPE